MTTLLMPPIPLVPPSLEIRYASESATAAHTDALGRFGQQPYAPRPNRPSSDLAPILRINEDVFTIIAQHLLNQPISGSLSNLSLCCWQLRQLSLPLLFAKCVAVCIRKPPIPPPSLRQFVRHMTFRWQGREVTEGFGAELSYMPRLRTITFESPAHGIPWEVIESCFSFPNIKAIRFHRSARFASVVPYPQDAGATSNLEELSYPSSIVMPRLAERFRGPRIAKERLCALETACLSTLALCMHRTARTLSLPLETAPIADMATVDWPALQRISLEGSAPCDADHHLPIHMPAMLRRMQNLRSLTLKGALPASTTGRHCILGRLQPPDFNFNELRTLVLSYPDPGDAVFSANMPNLLHLSLRDWPRHYDFRALPDYHMPFRSPLLSATQMLSILGRLHVPELRTLELVYRADEADDQLLRHIVQAFPKLRHLEIHRYRQRRGSTVDYEQIARTISSLETLATVRLHLDFRDDPGAYVVDFDYEEAHSWYPKLVQRGWEVLEMLNRCPELESAALLYAAQGPGTWVRFDRSQLALAGRKPVKNYALENVDTMPRPLRWRRDKELCSRGCEYCETCTRPLKRCRSWGGPLETV